MSSKQSNEAVSFHMLCQHGPDYYSSVVSALLHTLVHFYFTCVSKGQITTHPRMLLAGRAGTIFQGKITGTTAARSFSR